MSQYVFLDPRESLPLPRSFDYREYADAERELWALFPETDGKRVNFCQTGLTAQLYMESCEDGSALKADETYFLMPCPGGVLRPVRMRACRRLTLSEYRMSHLTAVKLAGKLEETARVMARLHERILGPEVLGQL